MLNWLGDPGVESVDWEHAQILPVGVVMAINLSVLMGLLADAVASWMHWFRVLICQSVRCCRLLRGCCRYSECVIGHVYRS